MFIIRQYILFKLNALCTKCCNGTKAEFTKRTSSQQEITLVGSNDIYEAVCRKHYLEMEAGI